MGILINNPDSGVLLGKIVGHLRVIKVEDKKIYFEPTNISCSLEQEVIDFAKSLEMEDIYLNICYLSRFIINGEGVRIHCEQMHFHHPGDDNFPKNLQVFAKVAELFGNLLGDNNEVHCKVATMRCENPYTKNLYTDFLRFNKNMHRVQAKKCTSQLLQWLREGGHMTKQDGTGYPGDFIFTGNHPTYILTRNTDSGLMTKSLSYAQGWNLGTLNLTEFSQRYFQLKGEWDY